MQFNGQQLTVMVWVLWGKFAQVSVHVDVLCITFDTLINQSNCSLDCSMLCSTLHHGDTCNLFV